MTVTFRDGYQVTAQEVSRLAAATDATYIVDVLAGGAVTPSAALTVAVAAVTGALVVANGVRGTSNYAGGTLTHDAAHATLNRRDNIYFQVSDGTVGITKGTAAQFPVVPDLSAGRISLAVVTIVALDATIGAGDIDDRRANLGAASFFDALRAAFRVNRRKVGEWAASPGLESGSEFGTGVGFGWSLAAADHGLSNVSGEPVYLMNAATAGTNTLGSLDYNGGFILPLAPNKSPRMLARVRLPAASANVTTWNLGFMTTTNATAAGAFLRINTTGNVFFVTDQAGTETVTDLGALSRVNILGFEIETADAGVTWVCRNQAGTVLATHTTNVPLATTALFYGITQTTATGGITFGVSYLHVEGTFA